MQILSVTLKNFKSHGDRHFAFQPGTNAICGENGAGKTSILEAIAWGLFNYRGDYRKDDFIRNGAASAQVTISFISSHDGRTYDVQRCTSKGYTIYDPQVDQRLPYTRIDEDVLPWLRQHMGVAPGTDLGRLFANTIGVPQGTFTADFLQPLEKRKQVFDAILKVEEFKQVYTRLGALKKYSEGIVDTLKREIEHYDEALQEREAVESERDRVREHIASDETALKALEEQLVSLQAEQERLQTQAQQVQALESSVQQIQVQQGAKQRELEGQKTALTQAQQAQQQCELHRAGYDAYQQADTQITALNQRLTQRKALQTQRDQRLQEKTTAELALAKLTSRLEALKQTQADLEALTPQVAQQAALEQQQTTLQQRLQHLKQCEIERHNLDTQVNHFRQEWRQLAQEIDRIQALADEVAQLPELEQRRDRLQAQLSRVEAAQQFEAELRQLVTMAESRRDRHQTDLDSALALLRSLRQSVPLLASPSVEQALEVIEADVALSGDLLTALKGILADLTEQISAAKLRQQLKEVKGQLDRAYRAQAETSTLEAKRDRQAELKTTAEGLQARMQELDQALTQAASLQGQVTELEAALKALDNPRGRQQILNQSLSQKDRLDQDYAQQQQRIGRIEEAIATLDQELVPFADLDVQLEVENRQRQQHQTSYQIVLQNQTLATQVPELEARLAVLQTDLDELGHRQTEAQQQLAELNQTYDPDAWKQVQAALSEARSRADQIRGSLPQQHKRLKDYEARCAALDDLAEKRDRAQDSLKANDKIKRFVNFARRVYKDAGPRITERYIQAISTEADRLFRELLNRQNVTLEWSRDYEIVVQEGAHQRRFINLSGGEQMCASLAVRLALLRVLADIDVAFFDEPTTNMDRPRRESLAEAIANIRSFRQLFVISHDDTFEQFTEHLVLVERDP